MSAFGLVHAALGRAQAVGSTRALRAASQTTMSPLSAVAHELSHVPRSSVIPQASYAHVLSRSFHSSAFTLGGRYTSQVPEKKKHWRANLSKKAKKRLNKQRDTTIRRSKSMPQLATRRGEAQTSAVAVAESKAMAAMPSPEELTRQRESNRTVIESVLLTENTPERATDELKREDPVALRRALAGSRSAREWTHLVRVLGAQGRLTDAVAAYGEMRAANVPPTARTLTALLTAAAQQRNLAVAQEVWRSLTGRTKDVEAPSTAQGKDKGEDKQAAAPVQPPAAARKGTIQPDTASYSALIQAYIRAFDLPGAFHVLACAVAGNVDLKDPVLWTHLIVGCVHDGQYEKAVQTFEHMRTYHTFPDAVAYTALITACAKTGEVERVLDLLTEMKQMGVQPTAVTYNAAIQAAGRSMRRFSHAHELFWEMDALGFARDVRTYHGVLLACSHEGDVSRAREYMSHMMGAGIKPDIYALNTVLTVYTRALEIAAKKPISGKKNLAKRVDAEALAMMKADGRELPALAQAGALSLDEDEVRKAERELDIDNQPATQAALRRAKELRHGSARRILGDRDDLTDALLADYFGAGGKDHPANVDKELEAIERGDPNDEEFAPPESAEIIDPTDPAWTKLKGALLESGLVSPGLIDDLEEEYAQRPAESREEELARVSRYEARHRARMSRLEAEALDIAQQEAREVGVKGVGAGQKSVPKMAEDSDESGMDSEGEDTIDVVGYDASSTAAGGGRHAVGSKEGVLQTAGLGGVFSDVMDHAQKVADAVQPHVSGAATSTPDALPTSSRLILEAAQTGSRIPMRQYMGALEKEILEASLGSEWGYETADEEGGLDAVQARQATLARHAQLKAADELGSEDDEGQGTQGAEEHKNRPFSSGPGAIAMIASPAGIPTVPSLPETPSADSPAAIRTPDGKVRVLQRRWVSMFGGSPDLNEDTATLGGILLRDLFDVNTIPLPPGIMKRLEQGARRGELNFADLEDIDVGSIYEHTEAVLRARVKAALLREAFGVRGTVSTGSNVVRVRAKRLLDAMVSQRTLFQDPLMSDNAEEYAALAGVKLPKVHGMAEQEDAEGAEIGNGPESSAQMAALRGLDEMGLTLDEQGQVVRVEKEKEEGQEGQQEGTGAQGGQVVAGDTPSDVSSMRIPAPGEEILLSSALSEAGPARNMDLLEAQRAEDPDGLTPVHRAHRSFTARVLARVLTVHPIGPIESNLVAAVEDAEKRRLRLHSGTEPGLLDALFAVQRLKLQAQEQGQRREVHADVQPAEQAQAADIRPAIVSDAAPSSTASPVHMSTASPSSYVSGSAAGGSAVLPTRGDEQAEDEEDPETAMERASEAVRSSPVVQSMVQAREMARQSDAKAALVEAAQSDPAASARLKGLAAMSDKLIGGAAWLPSAAYPDDRGERRRVLLSEMSRIYRREYSALGATPDKVTLNIMLNGYAAAKDTASAYAFLEQEFPRAGVQPDARTFRSLIKMHVSRRETDRAAELLQTMQGLGVKPDGDCYGPVVHARARDWRVRDAITVVQDAKSKGVAVPEVYAQLLRSRCKAVGVFHPDVPEHPIGWQFRPEIMEKRFAGAKSKEVRRSWTQGLRPKLRDGMR